MDAWAILHVDDLSIVFDWREAAEEAARLAGKPALTTDQVRDFVTRFFPAYRSYLPKLIDLENNGLGSKPTIKVSLFFDLLYISVLSLYYLSIAFLSVQ